MHSRPPTERSEQLDALREVFADVSVRGTGQLVALTGPVGSGKTELLTAFLALVRDLGAEVLTAQGSESEQSLPLGVIEQMLDRPGLPPDVDTWSAALLSGYQAPWHTYLSRPSVPAGPVLDGLIDSLVALATPTPLVVALDDAHFADEPSLHCLARLAARLREAPALVVVCEAVTAQSEPSSAVAMLAGGASASVLRCTLEPLSRDGVAEVLARQAGVVVAGAADAHHAVTGGNPALLLALLEDRRAAGATGPEPLVGDNFADAVTVCLLRCDPTTRQVAQVVAVQRAPAELEEVGRLLDLDATVVARAIDVLTSSGLVVDGRFRHPVGRSAVLASMAPPERVATFARVSRLHGAAEPSADVVSQLVEADRRHAEWMPPLLRQAAEQARADGDLDRAWSYVRAALMIAMDDQQKAAITATGAALRWRANPGDVVADLPELLAGVRAGRLTGRDAVDTVLYLLWHGQVDEAAEVLPLVARGCVADADAMDLLRRALTAVAVMYPPHTDRILAEVAVVAAAAQPSVPTTDRVAAARAALREASPAGDTVGLDFAALYVSTFAVGEDGWRDPWQPELPTGGPPTWQSLLTALRAELALRRGELEEATELAKEGLTALGADGWGVAVGWPISILICAASEAGDHGAAAGYLSMPVPAGMFSTPFGLRYLLARGRYHYATGREHAALNDFYACRETAIAWGLDLPELLPWRIELARAYVKLDRRVPGRELAREQLALLKSGQSRLRGATMRVLAGTLDTEKGIAMLNQAVSVLRRSGDRLELARAYGDLSGAARRAGRVDLARSALRAAVQHARICGATPPGQQGSQPRTAAEEAGSGAGLLTAAERRVAALAAKGYPNREIARSMFLTVSTVEQHLTKIYRKLNIERRQELVAWLRVGAFDDPS